MKRMIKSRTKVVGNAECDNASSGDERRPMVFWENYPRLRVLKKYDPDMVFENGI